MQLATTVRGRRSGEPGGGWAALAALLVVGGIAGTVFIAGSVARDDAEQSRQAFERSSSQVAATLQLAIQHEEDLVMTAGAFVHDNPQPSNVEFARWLRAVQAFKRYPELSLAGNAVIVPAKELPAFVARAVSGQAGPHAPSARVQLTPPGDRPYYCLASASLTRAETSRFPVGFDLCAVPLLGPSLLAARDSGKPSYVPFTLGGVASLAVQTPIYRGGVTPVTKEARREAFLSWVGIMTVPKLVLDRALQGHPNTAVTARYTAGFSDALFSSGTAPKGAQSVTVDLHDGWTVRTSGAVRSDGVWENGEALGTLIGGLALSLLLGVLVSVLGTGRARALRLVHERSAALQRAQVQLVDTARQAGMAEIATNVLHNVGNVLNSVNVSADLAVQKVRGSKSAGLARVVALLDEHSGDLGQFLTTDARGRTLPGYLDKLAAALAVEQSGPEEELLRLTSGVNHIKKIVAAQQSLVGVRDAIESVDINDLIDDALRMAGAPYQDVMVTRLVPGSQPLWLDRHRTLMVLLNLISNATQAMTSNVDVPGQLSLSAEVTAGQAVRITVTDNGEGIPPENLHRIFGQGFTTHTDGHGFGLHGSALAAKEMGGELTVQSDGAGKGAVFTLVVPLGRQLVTA